MTEANTDSVLSQFDVRTVNSAAISIQTPDTFANQLRGLLAAPGVQQAAQIEDLRLRLITNGMVAARLRGITPPWLENLDQLLMGEGRFAPTTMAAIEETYFLKVEDWMFVMAPPVGNDGDVVRFLSALNQAELSNRGIRYWIFDFSPVTYVNHALIAFLIGFQQNLLCLTPAISLLWLRPEAIPTAILATTKKRFNLFKKGIFLLSEGHPGEQPAE